MKQSERFTLLRSLFPSWRFFSEVVEVPVLQYRLLTNGSEPSAWRSATQKLPTRWHNSVINPQGNIAMAKNSLLEYFQNEIESKLDNLSNSVSYSLVTEVARAAIHANERTSATTHFEFRLGLLFQGSTLEELREIFRSEPIQVSC